MWGRGGVCRCEEEEEVVEQSSSRGETPGSEALVSGDVQREREKERGMREREIPERRISEVDQDSQRGAMYPTRRKAAESGCRLLFSSLLFSHFSRMGRDYDTTVGSFPQQGIIQLMQRGCPQTRTRNE